MLACMIFLNIFTIFLSGLQHGVIGPEEPYGLPLDFITLPQKLKEAGMLFIIFL